MHDLFRNKPSFLWVSIGALLLACGSNTETPSDAAGGDASTSADTGAGGTGSGGQTSDGSAGDTTGVGGTVQGGAGGVVSSGGTGSTTTGGAGGSGGAGGAPALCPDGMAYIPGGTYEMDNVLGEVTVTAFCMDIHHVTLAEYAACESCSAADTTTFCNTGYEERANDPANCVDAAQAEAYCQAQEKYLPTEQEWEWAARGGPAARTFPWGAAVPQAEDDPPRLCWGAGRQTVTFPEHPSGSCPVGEHKQGEAHPYGLEDMSGNVWQWTASEGDEPTDRVLRGGNWGNTDPAQMTTGFRNTGIAASERHSAIGFRCARAPLD